MEGRLPSCPLPPCRIVPTESGGWVAPRPARKLVGGRRGRGDRLNAAQAGGHHLSDTKWKRARRLAWPVDLRVRYFRSCTDWVVTDESVRLDYRYTTNGVLISVGIHVFG